MFELEGEREVKKLLKASVATFLSLWIISVVPAHASEQVAKPEILVELNKAQTSAKGCRISLLLHNNMGEELTQLMLDLVVFDQDAGVIDFLSMKTGRMPTGKKRVRQYELPASDCTNISSLLINDVSQCEGTEKVTPARCLDALKVSSRAAIDLTL